MSTVPSPAPSVTARGRRVAARLAERVSAAYDAAPLAPHHLADAAMSWQFRRADRRCATDPTWAAIEARRVHDDGSVTLFSDDLSFEDYDTQQEIRDRLAPTPCWFGLARAVKDRPLRRARHELLFAVQRVRRGWADADTFNLDSHLCRTLAAQLEHLAAHGHGWPGQPRYASSQAWDAALRTAGAGLRGWAGREETAEAEAHTDALLHAATDEERAAARAAAGAYHHARLSGAQDALRWVADNLESLWD